MVYTTIRCPNCGKLIEIMVPKGPRHYGSPLRTCVKCEKSYIDKSFIEIALEGIRSVDKKRVSPGMIILFLFGGFMLFGGFSIYFGNHLVDKSMSWLFFIGGGLMVLSSIISIIDELRTYKVRMEELETESRESAERLANKEYREFLRQAGIF